MATINQKILSTPDTIDCQARKIGILAPQGTEFSLNNGDNIMYIGQYGVYELDLTKENSLITKITISSIPEGGSVIVDYINEGV